jgi:hypothetical protein
MIDKILIMLLLFSIRPLISMLLPQISNSIDMLKWMNLIGLDSENCIKLSSGVVLNKDSVSITV